MAPLNNKPSFIATLLSLAALLWVASAANPSLFFTGSPAFITSNTSATINAANVSNVTYSSVNFYINGQFFCNGTYTAPNFTCSGQVPCVPADGIYTVSSQLVAFVAGNNATGPTLSQQINTDPLCSNPTIVLSGGAGPATNFDALTSITAQVTLGYNASNVIVMIGNSFLCSIATVTADVPATCVGTIPCSAAGSCLPVYAFGSQTATGEPTPYSTSGPSVLMISVNQVDACLPTLVTCGCPVASALVPGDVVNFALKLQETDSILNYQNLILTISNGAAPPLHVVLFESLSNLTLQCRLACCPGSPNSFLVFSWTIPCSYNNIGNITATLSYSIVNNCPGVAIQGQVNSNTPLVLTIGSSNSCYLTLSAAATAGPEVLDPSDCDFSSCCSSNPALFPANPFAGCYNSQFEDCSGCPSRRFSCSSASSNASGCSCAAGAGSNLLASAQSCCCGNAPRPKQQNFAKFGCAPQCADGLTDQLALPVDYQLLCQSLNRLLTKINLYATSGLNFLALNLTQDALRLSCPSKCETAAVKSIAKQIRYFELHGTAIQSVKSIIAAYQLVIESGVNSCVTPLITQIFVNGVAQLQNLLNCGKIIQALVLSRKIYDEVNSLNPSFFTATCIANVAYLNSIQAAIQSLLILEQSASFTNLLTNAIRTLNLVITCVCNNVPCCPTNSGLPAVVPVCQPCDGNPLCQLRPFDTVNFTVCDGGESANGTYALVSLIASYTSPSGPATLAITPIAFPANFPLTCPCGQIAAWSIPCSMNNVGPATVTLTYTFAPTVGSPITLTSVVNISVGYNPLCINGSSSCC